MSVNLNVAPYYDDFDPSKKYTQILAIPNTGAQARDFTQSQTMLLYMIKKLSGSILKEGSIISGMSFSIAGNVLTVESGQVYISGIIHDFDKQSIQITNVGEEYIGVTLNSSIITEVQDSSLRDPVLGSENYQQPGSHRVQMIPVLCRNTSNAPTIYKLKDGALVVDTQKPQLDMVTDLLAKRTFDEAGNYRVYGLNLSVSSKDSTNLKLTVAAGEAYVKGYQVFKPVPNMVTFPKAQLVRNVIGEVKIYHTGTNLYLLNNSYARDITQVVATVSATSSITKGINNGQDILPNTPVIQIQSVSQSATNFVAGVDFNLSGNSVDWSLGGAEPGVGSTYDVTYTYSKVMTPTTDYVLNNMGANSYLDFSPSGTNPADTGQVMLTYNYYLARADRVYLDSNGNISIIQGQSDLPNFVTPPPDSNASCLSLGTIVHLPNDSNPKVNNESITRLTMSDLSSVLQRLNNLEYNIALSDLDNQAMQGESPTTLKGVFTDGFLGFTKCDLGHGSFNAAIDTINNELVQSSALTVNKLQLDSLNSSNINVYQNGVMALTHTEQSLLSQTLATNYVNVNPYSTFPSLANISLTPSQDNWIDTTNVTVNQTATNSEYLVYWRYWQDRQNGTIDANGNKVTSTTSTNVSDTIEDYARSIVVTVEGRYFPPSADSLVGTIDGVTVSLTPVAPTVAGTSLGSVKADSNGYAKATFTIPAGTPTGAHNIGLSNPLVATNAVFTSRGILRTTTDTVLTTTTTEIPYDPVAETFQLSQGRFITKAKVYFRTKDSTLPVQVSIRNAVNGYPGTSILASANLSPSAVQTSTDGSVATVVTFDAPAYCQANTQYCIVIATASNQYSVFVATLGKNDLIFGTPILGQPYIAGSLFISSNALTWTAVQESDLKFELIGNSFSTSGTALFQPLATTDADSIVLSATTQILPNTTCVWEYRTSSSGSWSPIDNNNIRNLTAVTTWLQIRALLTSDSYTSPVLQRDNITLITGVLRTSGVYISKLVTLSQPYTTVRQVIQAQIPSTSTVVPQLSINNSTWVTGTLTSTDVVDDLYNNYTYTYTIPASGTSTSFRARINMNSPTRTVKPVVKQILNILK